MLIIGSRALKYHYPLFPREPKDLDYAVVNEDRNILIENDISNESGGLKIEYLKNPIILKHQKKGYISPDLLLSLKISHLFWDINWFKHMFDVQFLLQKNHHYNLELVFELIEYWKTIHKNPRRSNLEQTKEQFFNNNINKDINEHDYLHTLINPIPMYTLMLKDNSEVELCVNKWNKFTYEQKCDVVFEETAVMAYERYKDNHFMEAFKLQLKDNIIKHFPQYIALFAIENYRFLEKAKYNYRIKIKNKL